MSEIRVNTNELISGSQTLSSTAQKISEAQKHITNACSVGNAYDGQLAQALASITGGLQASGSSLQNRSSELSAELAMRANKFEAANEVSNNISNNIANNFFSFIENSPILRKLFAFNKTDMGKAAWIWGLGGLGFGGILSFITFMPNIRSLFNGSLALATAQRLGVDQSQTAQSPISFPEWAKTSLDWTKKSGDIVQGSVIVSALKNGQSYSDQVKIFGSNWYTKNILGLQSENLRNIKGVNLVEELASDSLKITPWATSFTLIKLTSDVIPDWLKYSDTAHRGAAVSIDAGIAAISLAASYQGMLAGGAIGSAICPGVGTVIGGLVGGFLSGVVTDHVLTTPVISLIPEAGAVVGGITGNIMLPGIGWIYGARLGSEGGKMVTGLINPKVTQLSLKDNFIGTLATFINGSGDFIGGQIYKALPQQ